MDDASLGLATRCHICYIRQGIYKCPKCLRRSCSVTCVKAHKKRSRCSGVRDPTEEKPLSWLRTPAGIDHDYNFLSGIERSMSRRNQELVEEGLFTQNEIDGCDRIRDERDEQGNIIRQIPKATRRRLEADNIQVKWMPKGMKRERENNTGFCRTIQSGINWQVEWILRGVTEHPALFKNELGGLETRVLHKTVDWKPIYQALESSLAWYTPENGSHAKTSKSKRKPRSRAKRRLKQSRGFEEDEITMNGMIQDGVTSEWFSNPQLHQDPTTGHWNQDIRAPNIYLFDFYLHLPQWPSGPTKCLMPLRPTDNLRTALRGRTIVEFPTIYVFPAGTSVSAPFEIQAIGGNSVYQGTRRSQVKASANGKRKQDDMNVDADENEQGQEEDFIIIKNDNDSAGSSGDDIEDATSSSSDDTSSDPEDETELSAGEISTPRTPNPTKLLHQRSADANRGNQRGRGRGRGRGWKENPRSRGGRSGSRHLHPHPDQAGAKQNTLDYADGASQNNSPRKSHQHHNPRGAGRGGNRGQRGRGGRGGGRPSRGFDGRSFPTQHARAPGLPSAAVPQKRGSEERDEPSGQGAPSTKKQKIGLVSYDSDSGPEEVGAAVGAAVARDLKRLGQ